MHNRIRSGFVAALLTSSFFAQRASAQDAPPPGPGATAPAVTAPAATSPGATAPGSAAGTATPTFEELLARQKALEEQLAALQRTVAPTTPPPAQPTPAPLAGYSDKNFFLRDPNDLFVLVPKGRINLDYYYFASRNQKPPGGVIDGAADNRPHDTLFIRRARLGLAGTIAKHVDFRVEADFASIATPGQYATVTDASIVANWTSLLELEVGQFYTPFTLENPTSENFTDFMEKSAATRFVVPASRDTGAMLFGAAPNNIARYWLGIFNGEGQDFKNLDYRPAYIGRVVFSPLAIIAHHPTWFENVWVGASGWEEREQNLGGTSAASTTGATQGDIANVTTQGGVAIFNSNYGNGVDGSKNAIRSHLAPNGITKKYAFELNVPVFEQQYGFRGEIVHQQIELSEYEDTSTGRTASGNRAQLEGTGGYAEAYVWLGQNVNVDLPGLYQVPHWDGYKVPAPPHWAVQIAAKYEHVGFDVEGLPNATSSAGKTGKDAGQGSYTLDVFELGASLWLTRHSRLMANWAVNYIGGGSNDPAPNEQKNLFFRRTDHELLFRAAASL